MPGIYKEEKIKNLLQHGVKVLEEAGIPEPGIDIELLLGFCLNKSRTALYLAADEEVEKKSVESFMGMLNRRKNREPLSYITREREFWSRSFIVSPAVLIPRPETEFLLETILARRNSRKTAGKYLDICCGCGVIATILVVELGRSVTAVDISFEALQIAALNIRRHQVDSKISLVQSDLVSCFVPSRPFSLIVSNPPYVSRIEIAEELEPEVSEYEPVLALDGGETGLDIITSIRDSLPEMLEPGGDCFLEIGEGQGDGVRSLFLEHRNSGFYDYVKVFKDYSDRDRVVHIRRSDT